MCHQVLMKILPAAIEGEFRPFAEGVSEVQREIGAYFADAQGGSMFASPAVGSALAWIGGEKTVGM
jgi:predicted sugar kinase